MENIRLIVIMKILNEIEEITLTSKLPDGDGVNIPTQIWAQDCMNRLDDATLDF